METYKCEVERIDKYEIEFNETECNEQWMEEFREYFYDFYTLEEHAKHIAQFRARFGGRFIEGYGVPMENGVVPYWDKEEQVNYAINIKVISEDGNIQVNVN